ncbi:hypothetical protein ACE1SV_54460 [Streptomyces sennicomposti]
MAGGQAFGALLRELRIARSLTIEGLAEASGVSVRGVGELERGRRAAPQRRTVAALADGLGLGEAERERLLASARSGRSPAYRPAGVRAFPRGVDDFVGRSRELERFGGLAERAAARAVSRSPGDGGAAHPVVVAVSGAPGTGKTTLALHAGRRLADRFPHGQLVLDLRGTDENPPAPAELLLVVLKSFGVPDRDLTKAGPEGHPALYRQLLAEDEGITVSRLVQRRRLEESARELARGGASAPTVSAVARRWGFVSPAHFSRVFRGCYGCSPLEWRRLRTARDGGTSPQEAPSQPCRPAQSSRPSGRPSLVAK